MKAAKFVCKLSAFSAVLFSVPGLNVLTSAAQQTPLMVASAMPSPNGHAMIGGGPGSCVDTEQEVAISSSTVVPTRSCPVPPTPHFVQYRAFIPADNLVTTVPCYLGQQQASPVPPYPYAPYNIPLGVITVLGDASSFATHFRIKQYAGLLISTSGPGVEPPIVPVPSLSYNFNYASLLPLGRNVVSTDFNPTKLLRCIHEQSTASASIANEGGSTSSAGANQATVTFSGSAADPLFTNPVAPIQYKITVALNTQTNMATLTGSHTCFPSHEIAIGSQVVYQKNPTSVNFARLSYCLIGAMVGLTETQVNCTVKLDGISKCN